jgi:hypothetical protein
MSRPASGQVAARYEPTTFFTAATTSFSVGKRPPLFEMAVLPSTTTSNCPVLPGLIVGSKPSSLWIAAAARTAWGL